VDGPLPHPLDPPGSDRVRARACAGAGAGGGDLGRRDEGILSSASPKSHGYVDLASEDARRLFFWSEPQIPPGWHGVARSLTGTVVFVSLCVAPVGPGEAKGKARALLTVLRVRGIMVPDAARERIWAEKDPARIERWLERAPVATSIADAPS
jgi:hypothetical protein